MILFNLFTLPQRIAHMSAQLDELTAQITQNNSLIESALTLIQGLKQQIQDAGTDPAKLQALVDALSTEDQKLATALASNTPGAPFAGAPTT